MKIEKDRIPFDKIPFDKIGDETRQRLIKNNIWFFDSEIEAIGEIEDNGYFIRFRGNWNRGNWYNGIWEDGIWKNGVWETGIWKNGVWRTGTWVSGTWENGTWKSGLWIDGTWKKGKIYSQKFKILVESKYNPRVFYEKENESNSLVELKSKVR